LSINCVSRTIEKMVLLFSKWADYGETNLPSISPFDLKMVEDHVEDEEEETDMEEDNEVEVEEEEDEEEKEEEEEEEKEEEDDDVVVRNTTTPILLTRRSINYLKERGCEVIQHQ